MKAPTFYFLKRDLQDTAAYACTPPSIPADLRYTMLWVYIKHQDSVQTAHNP